MKRLFFSVIIVLLSVYCFSPVSAISEAGEFFCTDAYVTDENDFSVTVSFSSSFTVTHIDFTVVLPDGIVLRSYVPDEEIAKKGELIVSDAGHRFVFDCAQGKSFEGGKALIKLIMTADSSLADGDYGISLENIRINDTEGNVYFPEGTEGRVTVSRNKADIPPDCRHSFDGWTVTVSPTYDTKGRRAKICRLCSKVCKTLEIPAIPRISLADAGAECIGSCVYKGKAVRPEVKVEYKGVTLEKGRDYEVAYAHNNSVGEGKVTIKGKGAFCSEQTLTFRIKPKSTKVKSVKKLSDGRVKITWSKVRYCDGYRIYVRRPGDKSYKLLKTVSSSSSVSLVTKKLKSDGKYRIKVKTFGLCGKKKINSSFGETKVFRL